MRPILVLILLVVQPNLLSAQKAMHTKPEADKSLELQIIELQYRLQDLNKDYERLELALEKNVSATATRIEKVEDDVEDEIAKWLGFTSLFLTLAGLFTLRKIYPDVQRATKLYNLIKRREREATAIVEDLNKLKVEASTLNLELGETESEKVKKIEGTLKASQIEESNYLSLYDKAYARAMKLYMSNEFMMAIHEFDFMLTFFKDKITITNQVYLYFYLGSSYEKLGDYKNSTQYYQLVLLFQPDFYQAVYKLGNIRMKKKEYHEAIRYYNEVLSIKPDKCEAWYNIGNACFYLGEYERAADCYEASLKCEPGFYKALLNLGSTYDELGNTEKALEYYDLAINSKSDHPAAWINKLELLIIKNRLDDASKLLGQYKERKLPDVLQFRFLEIIFLILQKQWTSDITSTINQLSTLSSNSLWSFVDIKRWLATNKDILTDEEHRFLTDLIQALELRDVKVSDR
ncbi:MAG: tetratricopeptide repeat protein [Bacteroidota bacterium]